MFLHGVQNAMVDIVILHAGSKLNLLIATKEGITTSLRERVCGGGEGGGVASLAFILLKRCTVEHL